MPNQTNINGLGSSGMDTGLNQTSRYANMDPYLFQTVEEPSVMGGVLSGVSTGASIGSAGGGWGSLIGAAVGGIAGGVNSAYARKSAKAKNKHAQMMRDEATAEQNRFARNEAQILQNIQNAAMHNDMVGFFALGGSPLDQVTFLAEGGEVIQDSPGKPVFGKTGSLNRTASDVAEVQGPSHNSPSRGVKLTGGERVFSDRLSLDPEDWKKFMIR